MIEVRVFTREGCHLCEDAIDLIRSMGRDYPTSLITVDIDNDSALRAQFDSCVPVVEVNGKIRFRGVVNRILLKRLFANEQRPNTQI